MTVSQIFLISYNFIYTILPCAILYLIPFKRKKFFVIRAVSSVAALILFSRIIYFTYENKYSLFFRLLAYVFVMVAMCVAVYVSYDIEFLQGVNIVFSGFAVNQFSNALFNLFDYVLNIKNVLSINSLAYNIINYAFLFACYAACYFLFIKKSSNAMKLYNISAKTRVGSSVLIVSVIVINLIRFSYADSQMFHYVCLSFYLITCVFILMLNNGKLKNAVMKYEMEQMERIWREKEKQLLLSRENAELISIKYHDLRHQISLLKEYNSNELSKEIITDLDETLNIYDSIIRTGNTTLDAVLIEQKIRCEKNGVRFSIIADGGLLSFMSSIDIVALFSNAIENAFNAVMLLNNSNRFISLSIKNQLDMLSVTLENPYNGELKRQNGKVISKHSDINMHGFGLKSMNMVVKKYGGSLDIETEDGIFTLRILIPLKRN